VSRRRCSWYPVHVRRLADKARRGHVNADGTSRGSVEMAFSTVSGADAVVMPTRSINGFDIGGGTAVLRGRRQRQRGFPYDEGRRAAVSHGGRRLVIAGSPRRRQPAVGPSAEAVERQYNHPQRDSLSRPDDDRPRTRVAARNDCRPLGRRRRRRRRPGGGVQVDWTGEVGQVPGRTEDGNSTASFARRFLRTINCQQNRIIVYRVPLGNSNKSG